MPTQSPEHLPVRPPDREPAPSPEDLSEQLPAFFLRDPGPTWSRLWVAGHLKGGSVKTTTAGTLAIRLHRHTGQRVCAIDADIRSQSLSRWRSANKDAWPDGVVVNSWPVEDLADRVRQVVGDFDHFVIDTGGHSVEILKQGLLAGTYERAFDRLRPELGYVRGADLIMPLACSFFDQDPLPSTVAAAREVAAGGVPLRVRALLAKVGRGGTRNQDYRATAATLEASQIPYMASYVGERVRWLRAPYGVPIGPADGEQYDNVLAELIEDEPLWTRSAA